MLSPFGEQNHTSHTEIIEERPGNEWVIEVDFSLLPPNVSFYEIKFIKNCQNKILKNFLRVKEQNTDIMIGLLRTFTYGLTAKINISPHGRDVWELWVNPFNH